MTGDELDHLAGQLREDARAALRRRATQEARDLLKDPEMKTPSEWEPLEGIRILDPDGWRHDGKPWTTPITVEEFHERATRCTVEISIRPDLAVPDPQSL